MRRRGGKGRRGKGGGTDIAAVLAGVCDRGYDDGGAVTVQPGALLTAAEVCEVLRSKGDARDPDEVARALAGMADRGLLRREEFETGPRYGAPEREAVGDGQKHRRRGARDRAR